MGRKSERVDRRTFRRLAGPGFCLVVLCCAGCGYTAGFTMPEGIETIHVKVFEGKTFYRGLDFDITQALKREILARTDLKVVREKDADVVLSGTVDKVEEFVLREDVNDVPQEMQIKLTISAVAKDRAGKIVFRENKLNRSVKYVIVLGEDERLARSRALQEVAEE